MSYAPKTKCERRGNAFFTARSSRFLGFCCESGESTGTAVSGRDIPVRERAFTACSEFCAALKFPAMNPCYRKTLRSIFLTAGLALSATFLGVPAVVGAPSSSGGKSAKAAKVEVATDASIPALPAGSPKPYGAIPSSRQLLWQRMEFYAFIHFGLNTFTGREWGYGDEDPSIFNPKSFDADAIVKTLKAGGMTGMIYTAKHHDGWCAWPTKTTPHNITKSAWKGGKGDVVREFSDACAKNGMKFGIYVSPWDRNHAEYGKDGYVKDYHKQITELLSNYGPIFELWLDGANGGDGFYGGAKEKRQIGNASQYYDFPKIVEIARKYQPNCAVWGAGNYGDVRWGGSEAGVVGYPHWAMNDTKKGTTHPTSCTEGCKWPRASHGIEDGNRWVPAEADTCINRSGWFWHKSNNPKSAKELLDIWFKSVGRGANLILNLGPDQNGKLDSNDVKALMDFKALRDKLFKKDFALNGNATSKTCRKGNQKSFGPKNLVDGDINTFWAGENKDTAIEAVIELPTRAEFDVVRLREEIRLGQRVKAWAIDIEEGKDNWKEVLVGSTIGAQAMLRLPNPVKASKIRLRITESAAVPCISELSLFKYPQ